MQNNFNCQQTVYLDLSEIIKKQANELKTAKSEAIKDFAERLIKSYENVDGQYIDRVILDIIDNLVKEMCGESEVKGNG